MFLRKDLRTDYPALQYYLRKNIPPLKRLPGVMRGLKDAVAANPSALEQIDFILTDELHPMVLVGDDRPRFYEPGNDLLVRWSTAEWFETKSPHTLRGRWGKVYLAGLELLLGTIDMLLYDGKVRRDQTPVFDKFLDQVYGLKYDDVLNAHSR